MNVEHDSRQIPAPASVPSPVGTDPASAVSANGSVASAPRPAKQGLRFPGTFTETGWTPPADLPLEGWLSVGETFQRMEASTRWWLGDWWNHGERAYGDMSSQAAKDSVLDLTGSVYDAVRKAGYVAERFPIERRRSNLSWSHHDVVAALPPEDADALLDQAEAGAWSMRVLKIAAGHAQRDGTAAAVDPRRIAWQAEVSRDLHALAGRMATTPTPGNVLLEASELIQQAILRLQNDAGLSDDGEIPEQPATAVVVPIRASLREIHDRDEAGVPDGE